MMFIFPGDCFPDASGVMMTLFEVLPHETGAWLESTLQMLPPGSMKPAEAERLLKGIAEKVQSGETRKIRVLLQGSFRLIFNQNRPFLTVPRFHQLLPPPQRGPPRWPWPLGGDPIPIQRMRYLFMCTIFPLLSFICSPEQKRNPRSICTTGVGPFLLTRYVACVVCFEAHESGRARDDFMIRRLMLAARSCIWSFDNDRILGILRIGFPIMCVMTGRRYK